MKSIFFSFFIVISVFSCKKSSEGPSLENWKKISDRVSYQQTDQFFNIQSGKFKYKIPKNKLPLKKVIFLNASLIGFAAELSLETKIVGISSSEYIYSEKINQLIASGTISDVGNEQKYNIEKIIALKPDAIFTNYIPNFENTYQFLQKNGIELIFLDEYMEQKPLEKAAYLVLFGELFSKENEAEKRYKEIEANYNSLKSLISKTEKKPKVLASEIYGNQWYLAGNESQLAHYLEDAGGSYIAADIKSSKAVPLSFEEVFVKAENVRIWVNVGNHKSKNEMLTFNPNYAKMKSFTEGKMYALTGKEKNKANDFFESGVVRADLVLQDYIKILHPELLKGKPLIYSRELR